MKPKKKDVYVPVTDIASEEDYILTHRGGFVKRMKKEMLYTFSEEELRELLVNSFNSSRETKEYHSFGVSAPSNYIYPKLSDYINNLLKQNNMSKQTAVDFLLSHIPDMGKDMIGRDIIAKAKELELQQVIDFAERYHAYLYQYSRGTRGSVLEMGAEQYFKEIYNQ